ncbi:MAG TPA: hypothetical protein VHB98_20395 [Chloroflexota bacterium]|nr:hypothetical protein [Chloroflexota bacterium]
MEEVSINNDRSQFDQVLEFQHATYRKQRTVNKAVEDQIRALQEKVDTLSKVAGRHIKFLRDRVAQLEEQVKALEGQMKQRAGESSHTTRYQ